MPFTGQLGTANSELGNIVLGTASGLGLEPFGFESHVTTSSRIRVPFTRKVVESSALDASNYTITSLAAPGAAVVPGITGVTFFDETRRAVVIDLDKPLTYSTDYSLQVDGVANDDGEVMFGLVKNFTANVQDPPRVLGAFQSRRGMVDVVFDRSVGPTSAASTFEIRDSSLPGPGVAMSQAPWAGEGIGEDVLRLELPGGTPTADGFEIDFFDVVDRSLNEASGTVPLTLALRSSAPYSLADLNQLQIVDASVIGVSDEFLQYGILRVYFNVSASDSDIAGNWDVFQSGPHSREDDINDVTAPNAGSLPALLVLLADFKAKFNAHLTEAGVHVNNDTVNAVTLADPVDEATAVAFLNDAQAKLLGHFGQARVHIYPDTVNVFNPLTATVGNLALSYTIANTFLKAGFNDHLEPEYELVSLSSLWSGVLNQIESWDRLTTVRNHGVRSAYSLFSDLHVSDLTAHGATLRIEATVTSEDGGSSTSPGDFTGSYVARANSAPATLMDVTVRTDEHVDIRYDRDVVLPGPDLVEVVDSAGRVAGNGLYSLTTTLPDAQRALKHVMNAYRWHITSLFAGHVFTDTINTLSVGDAPNGPGLQDLIDSANGFKAIFNDHMSNSGGEWHVHPDAAPVRTTDATDFGTAVSLIDDIVQTFLRHNGGGPHNGRAPHSRPGHRIYNVPLFTALRVEAPSMLDGDVHTVVGNVRSTYFVNAADGELGDTFPFQAGTVTVFRGERFFHDIELSSSFEGVATRPSLASALTRSGLVLRDDGVRLEADMAEVYFSKAMRQVPIDSSNLTLSGGSTLQKESSWVDGTRASVRVVSMTAVPHTLVATGLVDEAGNPVY